MAETSTTISGKIVSLLERVGVKEKLLTFGFVREIDRLYIVDEIINYCVIYAFLKTSEWYKGKPGCWIIDDTKLKAVARVIENMGNFGFTIYGSPEVSEGVYEWKIKLVEIEAEKIYIGLASDMKGLDSYFYGATSPTAINGGYCYAYTEYQKAGYKMNHTMGASQFYASNTCLSNGDILTIHLDLKNKTVGFSQNGKFLGVAFENIPMASYRVVITVYGDVDGKTFEFV